MSKEKFKLSFHPKALKEYNKLDGSVRQLVDKGIAKLRFRADEIGKPLMNKRGNSLNGCKELKYKDAGLRVVFRVTGQKQDMLEVVWILAAGARSNDEVFDDSSERLAEFLEDSKDE